MRRCFFIFNKRFRLSDCVAPSWPTPPDWIYHLSPRRESDAALGQINKFKMLGSAPSGEDLSIFGVVPHNVAVLVNKLKEIERRKNRLQAYDADFAALHVATAKKVVVTQLQTKHSVKVCPQQTGSLNCMPISFTVAIARPAINPSVMLVGCSIVGGNLRPSTLAFLSREKHSSVVASIFEEQIQEDGTRVAMTDGTSLEMELQKAAQGKASTKELLQTLEQQYLGPLLHQGHLADAVCNTSDCINPLSRPRHFAKFPGNPYNAHRSVFNTKFGHLPVHTLHPDAFCALSDYFEELGISEEDFLFFVEEFVCCLGYHAQKSWENKTRNILQVLGVRRRT